jgi:MFS family permease
VAESPVWLERQRQLKAGLLPREPAISLPRIFKPDMIGITIRTTLVIGAFMCIYYSLNFWYPTFLIEGNRPVLPYLAAFNFGAIAGTATFGRLSEGRLGRRGTATINVALGIASLPLYLHATDPMLLGLGALTMGFFGMGVWGMAPAYSNESFPTEVRGVGPGFCYHAAAAIGATMPTVLGFLRDQGFVMVNAMSVAMVLSGIAAMVIWTGPETRGRVFK